jgi:hypothetical protein
MEMGMMDHHPSWRRKMIGRDCMIDLDFTWCMHYSRIRVLMTSSKHSTDMNVTY